MKHSRLTKPAALALLAALGLVPAAAQAGPAAPAKIAASSSPLQPVASWRNPYGNVDPRNDAGNDTGNSVTDQLNAGQLDRNYRGPWYDRGQPAPQAYRGPVYAPPTAYAPPPAYYPPPGGYYPAPY